MRRSIFLTSNIIIKQVFTLPSDLDHELVPASIREGFEPIKWLRDDWDSGENRFNKHGEAFYVARSDERLIGVCGVNRDPYSKDDSMCRLRRLYVLSGIRRRGVGTLLVERAMIGARDHFTAARLRTLDDQSASFFEAIGFRKVEDQEAATHEMKFDGVSKEPQV